MSYSKSVLERTTWPQISLIEVTVSERRSSSNSWRSKICMTIAGAPEISQETSYIRLSEVSPGHETSHMIVDSE